MIIRADISALDDRVIAKTSEALANQYQIPRKDLLFNVSHTHSAPLGRPMDSILKTEHDRVLFKRWKDFLFETLLHTCAMALSDEEPCSMYFTKTCSELGMNRRKQVDGKIINAPERNGIYDPELPVIVLKNASDNLKCLLFSYACHPVTLGSSNYKLSCDYPGYISNFVSKKMGNCPVLFLQGCGGNIRPRILDNGDFWRQGTLEDLHRIGECAGQAILEAISGNMEQLNPCLASQLSAIPLHFDKELSRTDYEQVSSDPQSNPIKRNWADKMKRQLDLQKYFSSIPQFIIQKLQLAENTHILALSGEVVAEIGLKIKAMKPNMHIITLGYSNSSCCYIPTKEMFSEGGYEVESYYHFSLPGKLSPSMEEIIICACEKLLPANKAVSPISSVNS